MDHVYLHFERYFSHHRAKRILNFKYKLFEKQTYSGRTRPSTKFASVTAKWPSTKKQNFRKFFKNEKINYRLNRYETSEANVL